MYTDALTVAALAQELRETVEGGRVQDVLGVDDLSVGFEIYGQGRRRYLLASAHPTLARAHLTDTHLRRGVESAGPLLLLLRKWARGGRLERVEQPAFERILRLTFDHPDEGVSVLIVEIMGRHSNIILTDAGGMILDCIKRIGPDLNRYRTIAPHHPYVPPPPQEKLPPDSLTELRLRQAMAAGRPADPLWRALVAGVQAVSPLLAREMAFRAYGDAEIPIGQAQKIAPLLDVLRAFFAPREDDAPARPSVGWAEAEADAPPAVACFAPYALTHWPAGWAPAASMSAAIEGWLLAGAATGDAYQAARARLRAVLAEASQRVERRQDQLRQQLASLDDLDGLRQAGELVLAYGWGLRAGQTELVVDLEDGSPPRRIAVDPALAPAENAQSYFRRYQKARRSREDIPPLLDEVEGELERIRQAALEIELAGNRGELDEVRDELRELGYLAEKAGAKAKARPTPPASHTSPGGRVILVGRNSRQNDRLTFHTARPDDWWLHARGVPGAHVILRADGPVAEADLRRAAELAAYYSAGRGEASVVVDYTLRRHVRRRPGGGPGQVLYRREQTLTVKPAQSS